MLGFVALGALELLALARFPAEVSWSAPKTWVYLAFVLSLLAAGLYGWVASLRLGAVTGRESAPARLGTRDP